MRQWRDAAEHGLAITIDAPIDVLHSSQRFEVMFLLHEIVAAAERRAIAAGYSGARGFAGGSCKKTFCDEAFHVWFWRRCRCNDGGRRPAEDYG